MKDDADPGSFEIFNKDFGLYAKDNTNVFLNGSIIPEADPESLQVLNYQYTKDKNNVYDYGKILNNVDPATFTYTTK